MFFLYFGRRRFDCIDRKPAYPGIKMSCVESNRVEPSLAPTTSNTSIVFFHWIDDRHVHDPPRLFLLIPFANNTQWFLFWKKTLSIYHLNFLTCIIHFFFFFRFLRNQIIIIINNTKWIGYEYHYNSPLKFLYLYIYIVSPPPVVWLAATKARWSWSVTENRRGI